MIPFNEYDNLTLKQLTGGVRVSPILPFDSPRNNIALFNENRGRISLSGAQSKYSVRIKEGKFVLTSKGEMGTYILKPAITDFEKCSESPANEHLTMQIARKVFHIDTAANALCFFENGEAAYITRRFDVAQDGSKIQQEDFAALGGVSAARYGGDYKYTALSYEDIGALIRRYLPAWKVEMLKFFDIILFNFLFSNGDAHLKNFSVLRSPQGDYRLSPAYDLIDTHIHLPGDGIFALRKGLFKDGRSFPRGIGYNDFLEFGIRIGIPEKAVCRELDRFCADYPEIESMVESSFLSDSVKQEYFTHYHIRLVSYLRKPPK